jgi:hypothetical protein
VQLLCQVDNRLFLNTKIMLRAAGAGQKAPEWCARKARLRQNSAGKTWGDFSRLSIMF